MRVLVIGGGAREHTLVWKLAQSPKIKEIYAAPGNAGTAPLAHNLEISPTDIDELAEAVRKRGIELIVVGPEAPLAAGIVDHFQRLEVPIFGPTRAAAEIESSKVFAKELMQRYGVPAARSSSFSALGPAIDYVKQQRPPIVIKADGLAAGKGVTIAGSVPEAVDTLTGLMEGKVLGEAGKRVVIEEYLAGKEMSTFVFTDGRSIVPMVPACDYKQTFDNDHGPNTGGMGSYSPPYFYSSTLASLVQGRIMAPVVKAMARENRPYQGVLYGGLIITDDGPRVLEFNARFGDPETQVTLPLLKTDLLDIILAVINRNLDRMKIEWSPDACVGVVMASAGYPGSYKTGFPISGLDKLDKDILVFHAGTKPDNGQVVTSGGRVLTVVATGKNLTEAREKVYSNLTRIHFEGCHYRRDIALMSVGLDEIIKKLYFDYGVSSYLSEEEYAQFVKDSYSVIMERAKKERTIFYGELSCFNLLQARFADGVRKVIGFIVGACSEYDVVNNRPPISAIVIARDTGEPGEGFFGLSTIPYRLSTEMWELRKARPISAIVGEREAFWLEQVRKVFEYWKGR